jgi:hypothetical protein
MTGPSSPRCPWCEAPNPAGQAFCGSCGLELGVGPSPSPSRPPAAKPPFDLLRARNVYAFVIVTVVVFLAVSAAGWLSQSSGSPAVAPTSPPAASRPAPIATPTSSPTLTAATPTPTPTPASTASPSPTATPSPAPSTPTIAQAARGYLALATTYKKAVEAAYRKYGRTSTLKAQKAYWGALATAEAVFIADLKKIPFPPEVAGKVAALLDAVVVEQRRELAAAKSTSIAALNANAASAEAASTVAADKAAILRDALGLPSNG